MARFGRSAEAVASFENEPMTSGPFALSGSFEAEIVRFEELRKCDAARADVMMKQGVRLLQMAKAGDVAKLTLLVKAAPLMYWFTVQMFLGAAACGKQKVVEYMLEEGINLHTPPVDDVLLHVAEHCDDEDGGAAVVDVATYLVREAGIKVSRARRGDYHTAMHVACARGLRALVACLVGLGAEVNAVALDDVMPLHCAEAAPRDAVLIARMLTERGGLKEWRGLLRGERVAPALPPAPAPTAAAVPDADATAVAFAAQLRIDDRGNQSLSTEDFEDE
ncbi:hypothetical protein M885DRAFT_542773 [Pelagophyceae sp. CCMP2097]|nr:hypothetical protein M885DRAFT_542773 [Pelagophyceae sp. CCMP2097]